MNYSSILIITYGRSGSTLLQGILNSIEGCLIRGENYNVCYHLFCAYEALLTAKNKFGNDEDSLYPKLPWFGAAQFNLDQFIQDACQLIINQLITTEPDHHHLECIGFKEIRYLKSNLCLYNEVYSTRIHLYLDFLAQLFPNPAFITLTRNHEDVKNSSWWREQNQKE